MLLPRRLAAAGNRWVTSLPGGGAAERLGGTHFSLFRLSVEGVVAPQTADLVLPFELALDADIEKHAKVLVMHFQMIHEAWSLIPKCIYEPF